MKYCKYRTRLICGAMVMALPLLAGCGGVKKTLGLTRDAPDEFQVLKHEPLEIPDSFTLPPPQPGVMRPQKKTASQQAVRMLTGDSSTPEEAVSPGAQALLEAAGGGQADPQIRQKLRTEENAPQEEGLLDSLRDAGTPPDPVIDARREQERLMQLRKADAPVTGEGAVVRKPEKKSTLEKIFD